MQFEYREYIPEDFLSLASISEDEWQSAHQKIALSMARADANIERCLVATKNDEIVGYIYGFSLPNGTLIPEFLYVLPQYRNMGVGRHLLNELENKSGCVVSMIFYHQSLHDYYEKQGYSTGANLETAMKDIPSTKERKL